jgi:hypothetical protein
MTEWEGPQHERRHPPFQEGNRVALKYGAFSPRVVDPQAAARVAEVLLTEELAYLADPSFRESLWTWATRRTQADLIYAQIVEHQAHGRCLGCKRCRGWEERWSKFDRAAERAAGKLGLDPEARSEILQRLAAANVYGGEREARDLLTSLAEALGIEPVEKAAAPGLAQVVELPAGGESWVREAMEAEAARVVDGELG